MITYRTVIYMEAIDFFLLQMNEKQSEELALRLEVKLRCLTKENDFERIVSSIAKTAQGVSWFAPLVSSIRPYFVKVEDRGFYQNPLNAYLDAMVQRLTGSVMFRRTPDLNNFTEEERQAPHLQWLSVLASRYAELSAAGYKSAWRLCRISSLSGLTDEAVNALSDSFVDNEYAGILGFRQYVEWYLLSREYFEIENEKLCLEMRSKTESTLKAWSNSSDDDCVYWLGNNYQFHPMHQPFLTDYVKQVRRQPV